MYMQNIKEIWIHACPTYMVIFWPLQIIDVKTLMMQNSILKIKIISSIEFDFYSHFCVLHFNFD